MDKYVCLVCGYVYDPKEGYPDSGIAAGNPFNDLPDDWVCPTCGADKELLRLKCEIVVDENPQTTSRYDVRSIPTMLLFNRGEMVDSMVVVLPKEEIARHLQPFF